MPFKADLTFTVADMITFGSAAAVGLFVIFSQSAAIQKNADDNARNEREIHRVELQAKEDTKEVLDAVKELKQDTKEGRAETNKKLDMLLERELNGAP